MPEPEWINGDDFARGLVDECPECLALALRNRLCQECGARNENYDPFDYTDDPFDYTDDPFDYTDDPFEGGL